MAASRSANAGSSSARAWLPLPPGAAAFADEAFAAGGRIGTDRRIAPLRTPAMKVSRSVCAACLSFSSWSARACIASRAAASSFRIRPVSSASFVAACSPAFAAAEVRSAMTLSLRHPWTTQPAAKAATTRPRAMEYRIFAATSDVSVTPIPRRHRGMPLAGR